MRALVLGVLGQDGSYLAEHLAAEGHEVTGLVRTGDPDRLEWIRTLVPGIRLLTGDILDRVALEAALRGTEPDEIYNLAAVTAPGRAWGSRQPPQITEVTGLGPLRLVEAVERWAPHARLVNAGSAAIFDPAFPVQDETTPIRPAAAYGPYGAAKAFAHLVVEGYRTGHGRHASTAILFSHTSPRQAEHFLARRIATGVARVARGQQRQLSVGDLGARRDWGWAPDYVRALPLIARHPEPGDYVVATGEAHSVGDFVRAAFEAVGLDHARHLAVDPGLVGRFDVQTVTGDPGKAHRELGWKAETPFPSMVAALVGAAATAGRRPGG